MKKTGLTIKTMINKRFIMIRKNSNLTQKEMSRKLGISVTTISTIENKRQLPTLSLTISLIDIFHISPLWLLKGEGEMFIKDKEPELNQQEHFKKAFPKVPAEPDVIQLIESMANPILKNALILKFFELKDHYKSQMEEYEKENVKMV